VKIIFAVYADGILCMHNGMLDAKFRHVGNVVHIKFDTINPPYVVTQLCYQESGPDHLISWEQPQCHHCVVMDIFNALDGNRLFPHGCLVVRICRIMVISLVR